MSIKVIIVDDHQMLIDGIIEILKDSSEIEIVGSAMNGQLLLELMESTAADVVLLDFDMPVMNGLNTTIALQEKYPLTKVLMLTSHDQTKIISEVFKAGAMGYLLKNAGKEKLVEAIIQVHQGNQVASDKVMERLIPLTAAELKKEKAPVGGVLPDFLTSREVEILRLIALEYSTQDICKELFIAKYTVDSHRKNLLRKTDAKNVAGLVNYAIRHGVVKL